MKSQEDKNTLRMVNVTYVQVKNIFFVYLFPMLMSNDIAEDGGYVLLTVPLSSELQQCSLFDEVYQNHMYFSFSLL